MQILLKVRQVISYCQSKGGKEHHVPANLHRYTEKNIYKFTSLRGINRIEALSYRDHCFKGQIPV